MHFPSLNKRTSPNQFLKHKLLFQCSSSPKQRSIFVMKMTGTFLSQICESWKKFLLRGILFCLLDIFISYLKQPRLYIKIYTLSSHFFLLGLKALIAENTRRTDSGAFVCLVCNTILKSTTTRNKHYRDVHWAEAPTYACPCQKLYTSKAAFIMHLIRHRPELQGVVAEKFIRT